MSNELFEITISSQVELGNVLYVGSYTSVIGRTIPVLAYELPIDALVNVLRVVACYCDFTYTRMLIDSHGFSSKD